MTRTLAHPHHPASLDDVQHLVLEDASWELYEKLLEDIGDRPIRVTYDRGRMEIMSVVEIDVTSRSVPRLPIYAALGVPEAWRYDNRQLHCLHLVAGKYTPVK